MAALTDSSLRGAMHPTVHNVRRVTMHYALCTHPLALAPCSPFPAFSIVCLEVRIMLKPLLLTVSLTCGLFLLSALCRSLLHSLAVRRCGLGVSVVVGREGDPLLPFRVYTSWLQSGLSHLEPPGEVVVLDCGLSEKTKAACAAILPEKTRLQFVPGENLCDYLVASGAKKEYNTI